MKWSTTNGIKNIEWSFAIPCFHGQKILSNEKDTAEFR